MLRKPAKECIVAAFRRYPVVRVSTDLDAPAASVWEATKRSATLVHVTRGMLGFAGAGRFPEEWREGDVVRTRLMFFNMLPAWAHELRIVRVDERNREIYSNERDALVPLWNHRIKVEEIPPLAAATPTRSRSARASLRPWSGCTRTSSTATARDAGESWPGRWLMAVRRRRATIVLPK